MLSPWFRSQAPAFLLLHSSSAPDSGHVKLPTAGCGWPHGASRCFSLRMPLTPEAGGPRERGATSPSPREVPLVDMFALLGVRFPGFERPVLDTCLLSNRGFANISLEAVTCLFMHVEGFSRSRNFTFSCLARAFDVVSNQAWPASSLTGVFLLEAL